MSHHIRCGLLAATALSAALGCSDDAESPLSPALEPAQTTANAAAAFKQVVAGALHNCAITTTGQAYCWGWNVFGQIGNGSTSFDVLTPAKVMGGHSFRQISAGTYHTCGVTMDDRAYCWGGGDAVLGDGTASGSSRPVAVAGGLRFRQVSAGNEHTCGVTTNDRAYCWGSNSFGQLGNSAQSTDLEAELAPVPVMGTLRFRGVSTGHYHSCGVTTTSQAYCWGGDQWGQIGDGAGSGSCQVSIGTQSCRKKPTLVVGGYQWRQVDAGGGPGPGEGQTGPTHAGRTCGVTNDGRAFCWGDGTDGLLGDGTFALRSAPARVAGSQVFRSISTGDWHTCAVTTENRAYCWGVNHFGQLGDGTRDTRRLRPRAVVGGRLFDQVSAGLGATCGRTTAGAAYCWGNPVGDGTNSYYLVPERLTVAN